MWLRRRWYGGAVRGHKVGLVVDRLQRFRQSSSTGAFVPPSAALASTILGGGGDGLIPGYDLIQIILVRYRALDIFTVGMQPVETYVIISEFLLEWAILGDDAFISYQ